MLNSKKLNNICDKNKKLDFVGFNYLKIFKDRY